MRTSLSVLALILMAVSGMPSSAQTYVATDAPGQAWGGYTLGATSPVVAPVESSPPAAGRAYPSPPGGYPLTKNVGNVATQHSSVGAIFDPAVRVAQAPSLGDFTSLQSDEGQPGGESLLPPGTRSGAFQKVKSTATYMPQFESDSLGITDLRTSLVFGLPLITRETPLVIEPEYRVRILDRPAAPDLPSNLHDVSLQFRHFRRLSSNWIFDGAVTVGYYADDHSFDSSDAFQVTGRALGVWEASDAWKWIFGVVVVNRAGSRVLPAAGLAYQTDTVKYELVFPRPRAAWMLSGSTIDCDERWVYVMGEFGGGRWAINRPATGTPDTLSASDYRILFGYERKVTGGLTRRFEFGYVFGRELEFDSGAPVEVSLDDTFLVRAGFSY